MKLCWSFLFLLLLAHPAKAQEVAATHYVCPPCNSNCDELIHENPGSCDHCGMILITEAERDAAAVQTPLRIAFYLQTGVEVLDFAGPMEVFAYAGFEVFTVSKTKDPIVSQGILTIIPDYSIEDAPEADILAFFGGNSGAASGDPAVIDWAKAQEVDYYFSVCTGAFVLAEAGVLNGQKATTFHRALDNLESNYPATEVLRGVRFVDNGLVVTTAGISAGIDGALHMVAKLQGLNQARMAAYNMEYDKWVPGEGLLLTADNPYASLDLELEVEDYVGQYEIRDMGIFDLHYSTRERSLYFQQGEQKWSLLNLSGDEFETSDGERFIFKRDEKGKVVGMEAEGTFIARQ